MFSKTRLTQSYNKSIQRRFVAQLVVASGALLAVFSLITYIFIQITIYDDLANSLLDKARNISKNIKTTNEKYEILEDKNINFIQTTFKKKIDNQNYLIALYPHDRSKGAFIKLKQNISDTQNLLGKILQTVILINIFSIILIVVFAIFLTNSLLIPIQQLSKQLSSMNENFLASINISLLPDEFKNLGMSINNLIKRIQNYTKYQKELFIGTAHELKTPLAVMKTKNEVTLIKKREQEVYIETLRLNNKKIDDMNNMISNILKVGRQEGAQFERPIEIDIIAFLNEQINEFRLLCGSKAIEIKTKFKLDCFMTLIQPTLLLHILQNFIQNAIKFSEDNSFVEIRASKIEGGLKIEVVDNGIGIHENEDLFAPFKRIGNKAGAGLGLFLAKSAADGLGAYIDIKNRKDGKSGCVATLIIYAHCSCDFKQQTKL